MYLMPFDNNLVEYVAANTGLSLLDASNLLRVIDECGDYKIIKVSMKPRKLRCKQCKRMKEVEMINERDVCDVCNAAPTPDDRDRSVSIPTISGGLPTLGKRRK